VGCGPARVDPAGAGALWSIVSTCVDHVTHGYCGCSALALSCCSDPATPDTDVVWARTREFVAIRDMKMCGCPAGFVAGLALPRTRVTGIEDPRRPDGIWPFAWETARTRIPDERQIGLAINPKDARTENQLHVHLLRLRPDARAWIDSSDTPGPVRTVVISLTSLDAVFTTVVARVGAPRMADTGILVARARAGGWVAVVTDRTSPQAFTINRWRATDQGVS
jgi:CDP-diacylglycerol pyrophosphatase